MKKLLLLALIPLTTFAATATYHSRTNDTLKSVATKYGMTVQELAALNPNARLVSQTLVVNTVAPAQVPTQPAPSPSPTAGEIRFNAYITGYSYWDNTPLGSVAISNPVIHQGAGGTGTYQNPVTLAVGHVISGGKDTLDYPAGTIFYFPYLKRYAIVEDTCGDGNTPQNGPCHTGYNGNPWLDVYVGKGVSQSSADVCMNKITDLHAVIENPAPNYPVVSGEIALNCATY